MFRKHPLTAAQPVEAKQLGEELMEKTCAGCWAECEVLPSAAYTGDLLRHALRRPARFAGRKKPHRVRQGAAAAWGPSIPSPGGSAAATP